MSKGFSHLVNLCQFRESTPANMHHHSSPDKETAIAEHVEVIPPQPYLVEVGEKGHNDGWVAERNADDKDVVTMKTWLVCIVS